MTLETSASPSYEEVAARLTGEGSPFETVTEEVLGERISVYKNRARSLRDLLIGSKEHDDKTYFIFDDGRDVTYWTGAEFDLPAEVSSYFRVPSGHNEDFFPALANLHTTIERQIRKGRGEKTIPAAFPHPGVEEGVAGMKFIKAAVDSSKKKGAWTRV